MSWLKTRNSKEKESTVMNLIAVMLADGEVAQEEKEFLAMVCMRVGLSANNLAEILRKPEKVKFTPPKNYEDRIKQLIDVVCMMLVDGNIDQYEMDMCITIALQLGFHPTAVEEIINKLVCMIESGRVEDVIHASREIFGVK